jgi:glycosyltransferase involved in cell wall biosynthesis
MIPYTNNWGGCQRMYFLSESLIGKGYKVWIMSSRYTDNKNYYGQSINFEQILIDHPLNYNKSHSIETSTSAKKNIFYYLKKIAKNIIHKIDRALFNEPNPGMGILSYMWAQYALEQLKNTITINDIDKIIISGPPFTLFLLAQKLKRSFKSMKIIVDYRDPWNLWNNRRFPSLFFEKKYLKYADLVTVTTDTLKEGLEKILRVKNCEIIYNGFSNSIWSNIKPKMIKSTDKIIVSYIGSIDFQKGSYRDTTVFFNAYKKFVNKRFLEIRFVGITESEVLAELRSNFPEIIFTKKVSVSKALEAMLESDYLLNIHTANDDSSKYLMGGKIFDYLRSNKRIISINDSKSFEHRLLEGKNAILCRNDETEILEVLNQIVNEKYRSSNDITTSGFLNENIGFFSRENQNLQYIKLIEELR